MPYVKGAKPGDSRKPNRVLVRMPRPVKVPPPSARVVILSEAEASASWGTPLATGEAHA